MNPLSRRAVLAGTAAVAAGTVLAGPAAAAAPSRRGARPTVVLVHGAWADASSWSAVIERLHRAGLDVVAPQLHLRGVADDAALVRRVLDGVTGPVVLAGHSYGGAVATAVGGAAEAVTAVVYAAAFVPDRGESVGALVGSAPPPPVVADGVIVADAAGDLLVRRDAFPAYFCPDLGAGRGRVLAATQGALAGAVFDEALAGTPAWRRVPTFYQVSTHDRVINPDLQRRLAQRAGAHTVEVDSDHASPLSHPADVTRLILRAARG